MQQQILISDEVSDQDMRARVFLSAYHARREGHIHTARALEDIYIQLCAQEGPPCNDGRELCARFSAWDARAQDAVNQFPLCSPHDESFLTVVDRGQIHGDECSEPRGRSKIHS